MGVADDTAPAVGAGAALVEGAGEGVWLCVAAVPANAQAIKRTLGQT